MTGDMNKKKSEAQIQAECVKWLWNNYPETRGLFFAVNNNSEHVVRAMGRKAVGQVPGVSDTIFLWNGIAYLIEFKTESGRQSLAQEKWQQVVDHAGFYYFIVRSLEEFQELTEKIL